MLSFGNLHIHNPIIKRQGERNPWFPLTYKNTVEPPTTLNYIQIKKPIFQRWMWWFSIWDWIVCDICIGVRPLLLRWKHTHALLISPFIYPITDLQKPKSLSDKQALQQINICSHKQRGKRQFALTRVHKLAKTNRQSKKARNSIIEVITHVPPVYPAPGGKLLVWFGSMGQLKQTRHIGPKNTEA